MAETLNLILYINYIQYNKAKFYLQNAQHGQKKKKIQNRISNTRKVFMYRNDKNEKLPKKMKTGLYRSFTELIQWLFNLKCFY